MQYNMQSPITCTDGKKALLMIPPALPRKVDAAISFVQMLGEYGTPRIGMSAEYARQVDREFTDGESRAYEAALAVINLYFTGEMSFEDSATVVEVNAAIGGGA